MLSAFLTWASLFLAVISVGLAVYFYRRKYDGSEAAGKAEKLGLELTNARTELTKLRETSERSERRRAPVHVLLDQPSRR